MITKLIKKIIVSTITTIAAIGMLSVGASASWRQDGYGWWNQKGNGYSTGWDRIGGKWFYFNPDGYMKTGWLNDGGKWYYLNTNGDMATGWIQSGGKWYYLNQSGDMLLNAFIDGYRLGADGVWINNDSTNVTTGAAANVIVDPTINTTTGSAVTLPSNNYWGQYTNQNNNLQNYENYLNQYNNGKNKLENLADKYQQKLDEQAQKMEEKMNRTWWYLYR